MQIYQFSQCNDKEICYPFSFYPIFKPNLTKLIYNYLEPKNETEKKKEKKEKKGTYAVIYLGIS
jgi:hypothetical protein